MEPPLSGLSPDCLLWSIRPEVLVQFPLKANSFQDTDRCRYRDFLILGGEAPDEYIDRFMGQGLEPELRIYP